MVALANGEASRPPVTRRGAISLGVAALGAVLAEICLAFNIGPTPLLRVMAAAFEAGMIGGLADWFAVSALFRRIPLPLVSRHTNLLVKRRREFSAGIVRLVEEKWLSPTVIHAKFAGFSASQYVIDYLGEDEPRRRTLGALRAVCSRVAVELDSPHFAGFIERALKDQLRGLDVGRPLGQWLTASIERQEHHGLWDVLLSATERSLHDGAMRALVEDVLKRATESYASEGTWKKLGVKMAELTGMLDYGSAADKAIAELTRFLVEAQNNPSHPLRLHLDRLVLQFAHDLRDGREETTRIVEDFKNRLTENVDAKDLIQGVLSRFKVSVQTQLSSEDSDLVRALDQVLVRIVTGLRESPGGRERLDEWVRTLVSDLITRHHKVIGQMVESSLSKLSDEELVTLVRDHVGNDLQWIRVNGAVIGALTGGCLAVIKMALTHP
jgi:uncharacterized membrane-anchored protein YjiN (DUF445 family)